MLLSMPLLFENKPVLSHDFNCCLQCLRTTSATSAKLSFYRMINKLATSNAPSTDERRIEHSHGGLYAGWLCCLHVNLVHKFCPRRRSYLTCIAEIAAAHTITTPIYNTQCYVLTSEFYLVLSIRCLPEADHILTKPQPFLNTSRTDPRHHVEHTTTIRRRHVLDMLPVRI